MDWCFASINNRLAEIYFEKQKDREYVKLNYRKGRYQSENPRLKLKSATKEILSKYNSGEFYDEEKTFG